MKCCWEGRWSIGSRHQVRGRSIPSSPNKHYGRGAILRSLGHFLIGRAGAGAATLAVLLLSIRYLTTPEFAAYASLHALVLVLGLVTSLGINPLLLRMLPELRTANNNRAVYRLLTVGTLARVLCYGVGAAICLAVLPAIASWLKLTHFEPLLALYLLVGLLRVNGTFLANALESLLWQKQAQYSLALGALLKLALVAYSIWQQEFDLTRFVYIELCADGAMVLLLLVSGWRRWQQDTERHLGDASVLTKQLGRYGQFSVWAYAQNLTSVMAGSAPNRLFVATFFASEATALYGVLDRLTDYVRRYEPTRLLLGIIRPAFNARYREDTQFDGLAKQASMLIRLNLTLLGLPLAMLVYWSQPLLAILDNPSYSHATWLLVGMYALVIIGSLNTLIDVLVKLVERAAIYTISNLLLSASLLLAIPLIEHLGLWSIVLANAVGLTLAMVVILGYMRSAAYSINLRPRLLAKLVLVIILAIGAGQLAWLALGSAWAAGAVTGITYLALLLVFAPICNEERSDIQGWLKKRREKTPKAL